MVFKHIANIAETLGQFFDCMSHLLRYMVKIAKTLGQFFELL